MYRNPELDAVEEAGIYFPGALDWARPEGNPNAPMMALDEAMASAFAMDAGIQPGLITQPNAGIPYFLSTYVDPRLVEVILSPNKAAEILGESRKGDWTDETAMFEMVESTGEVSSYGDFSTNGRASANTQWENRQAYLYQAFTEWGERELARMARGRVDWAARLNIASAIVLNKFQNQTYFFGVRNLQNYGLLNDPSLSAPLTPATKQAGGTGWQAATSNEILADVQVMFKQLQAQTRGQLSREDEFVLALSPESEVWLVNTNEFGLTAIGMIKTAFPKLEVVSATQYQQDGVETCQLLAKEVAGQPVGTCSFNEKMRAHRIIQKSSSWKQKKTQGTWGTILTFPAGIAQMAGI